MPQEDSNPVEVANFSIKVGQELVDEVTRFAVPIDFGGHGDVCELLAVHYSPYDLFASKYVEGMFFSGLSSNFELLDNLTLASMSHWDFAADRSIYGRYMWRHRQQGATPATGNTMALIDTSIIPLYGLIRPRRQVWVIVTIGFPGINAAMELYYRPIRLADEDRDTVNRRYGKYRRS
ncbi:hypothetical protein ES708_24662 [subsurface metagenome]